MRDDNKQDLTADQKSLLICTLRDRFNKNKDRHKGCVWTDIETRLQDNPEKLWSLHEMERTGGEPDVIGLDSGTGQYIFCDCSAESPKGRRSISYDTEAIESRKEHKPKHSALGMAAEMGIELLTEEQYFELQRFGIFDSRTSSWLYTDKSIRNLGGAVFGDRRYGRVFIYHNGAESYYGSRGFRGLLKV